MADHVCPVWVGYLLASPVRKLLHRPTKVLGPLVEEGMTVLDVGCAMGFFSLPLARMVGPHGKVICVDVQEAMLERLERRAGKAGLRERIETRLCRQDGLGLDDLPEAVNFALAFAVVHEVPDASGFFRQTCDALRPGGKLLVAEPKAHVSEEDFAATIVVARENGFAVIDSPRIGLSRSALFGKSA